MAVFNDANITETPLAVALASLNLPNSEDSLNFFIEGWRNDNLTEVSWTVFTGDPPLGANEPVFPTIGVQTSGITGGLPDDILGVYYYDGEWVQLYPPELPTGTDYAAANALAFVRCEMAYVAQRLANAPIDSPSDVKLFRIYANFNAAQNTVTEVFQVFFWIKYASGGTGKWIKIFDTESSSSGGSGTPDPVQTVVNSTVGSPNGLYTSRFRGDMIIYGSVSGGVVSTTGARVFMALNGSSASSWVQIN